MTGKSASIRVEVAVGVLIRATDQAVLLTSRPAGKPCDGFWEFPGGKLELGETVDAALRRELQEELGILIGSTQAWKVSEHDYPHASVRLHWRKVFDWTGDPVGLEGQQVSWQQLPIVVAPVLPGSYPALAWLAQERGFVGATVLVA